MTLKKIALGLGIIVLLAAVAAGTFFGLYVYPFMQKMKTTNIIRYDDHLTLITGGGGNSGILTSDSLILVVDTKMDEAAQALADQVKALAGNKPVFVVNTHIHSDHIKGNVFYKGQTILAGGNYGEEDWIKENGEETLPNQWLKDSITLKVGDEKVTIINLGFQAHTQSDVVVYLHNRKMLFGGDVILNKQAPALFAKFKADPDGYLAAFDELTKRFEIKTIVPGHGPIGGIEIIEGFRGYFKDIKAAALNPSMEDSIVRKYEGWNQIPFLMATKANIGYVRGLEKK